MSFFIPARRIRTLIAIVVILIPFSTKARIWQVRVDGQGDAPTIQAAIDSAVWGDRILVFPGTYREFIELKDGIDLVSAQGAEVTSLEPFIEDPPPFSLPPLILAEDVGPSTRVRGFTIGLGSVYEQRYLWWAGFFAPGFRGSNCSAILEDNRFIRNFIGFMSVPDSLSQGAAVTILGDSSPVLRRNLFEENILFDLSHGFTAPGGVVYIAAAGFSFPYFDEPGDGWATLEENEFLHNGYEGGVEIRMNCIITENLFFGNIDGDGALAVTGDTAIIRQNIFVNNAGPQFYNYQGVFDPWLNGMTVSANAGEISQNTFLSNIARWIVGPDSSTFLIGGMNIGAYGNSPEVLLVERNLVVGNQGWGIRVSPPGNIQMSCNLTYGNKDPFGNPTDLTGIPPDDGHLFYDPHICYLGGGNYSLPENSPALIGICGLIGASTSTCGPVTGIKDDIASKGDILLNVYPNPFNPKTTVMYNIPSTGIVNIRVYDVRGILVQVLLNETNSSGQHAITWDTGESDGLPIASGIYFIRIETGGQVMTRKIVLLK